MIIEWAVLATGLTFVAVFVFGVVYAFGFQISDDGSTVAGFTLVSLLIAVVLGTHEAIHAVVIGQYGGDVPFGVRIAGFVLPYAYMTTTQRLIRNQFIAVSLAPLVVITVIGVSLDHAGGINHDPSARVERRRRDRQHLDGRYPPLVSVSRDREVRLLALRSMERSYIEHC